MRGIRVPKKKYIKCYLNNKKLNAAEKHRRDVLFYELAIV